MPVIACLWCELQHLALPIDLQSHRLLLTRHHCQHCFHCHQTPSVFMSYFFYMFTQWQSIFPSPSLFSAHVLHRFCSTQHSSGRHPTFDRSMNAAWWMNIRVIWKQYKGSMGCTYQDLIHRILYTLHFRLKLFLSVHKEWVRIYGRSMETIRFEASFSRTDLSLNSKPRRSSRWWYQALEQSSVASPKQVSLVTHFS
jgi:hypothetical protein